MNSDKDIILFKGILIIKLHDKPQFPTELFFSIRQMIIALKNIVQLMAYLF